jgi:hypothetical protein
MTSIQAYLRVRMLRASSDTYYRKQRAVYETNTISRTFCFEHFHSSRFLVLNIPISARTRYILLIPTNNIFTPELPFCFPIWLLENSRLTLEPFDLSIHADLFVEGSKNHPDFFAYVSDGPFPTTFDFSAWCNSNFASSSTVTIFAILTKPAHPTLNPPSPA